MAAPVSKFKSKAKANILNTDGFVKILEAPVGKDCYAIELDIANTSDAGTGLQVSVRFHDASESVDAYIVKKAPIPTGSSLSVIDNQKVVLEAGDYIELLNETPGVDVKCDSLISYVEDVNS